MLINMIVRTLLLTMTLCGITTFSRGIDRGNVQRFEGDTCPLKAGGNGVCRKTKECVVNKERDRELHCNFSGNDPVICCAIVLNETFRTSTRVVKNVCNTVRMVRFDVIDHVVGVATEAVVGEFPFMGLLTYEENRTRCGAALISNQFLLTAAHCFNRAKPLSVRLGTNRADDQLADTYPIAKIFRHPKYNKTTKQNDIALVELSRAVNMNADIQPICLHTSLTDLPESTNMTIMGWGQDNTEESSTVLLKGIVQPVLRSTCQSKYKNAGHTINLSDNQICALGNKNAQGIATDGCQGDSGGPLVFLDNNKYYLAGIVSVGTGCGNEFIPGIYTRIANYLDWVTGVVWKNQKT